ncbi:MAG: VOC family protein [Pseudomonadota bacterium]
MTVESINAITFATHDMRRAVAFYEVLGFRVVYGGPEAVFTSLKGGGDCFVNLTRQPDSRAWSWWGRVIFHVHDVDEIFALATRAGYDADTTPRDAEWGERYFHITDPDGHELSFARRLA